MKGYHFSKTMPRISSQVTESTDPAEYETDDSRYDHAYSRGRTLSKTSSGQCDSIFFTPKKWSLPWASCKLQLMHVLYQSLYSTFLFNLFYVRLFYLSILLKAMHELFTLHNHELIQRYLFWVAHDVAVLWTKLCSFGNLVLKKTTSHGITNLYIPSCTCCQLLIYSTTTQ